MINSDVPKKDVPKHFIGPDVETLFKKLEPVDNAAFNYKKGKKNFWQRLKKSPVLKFFGRTATAKNLPGRIIYSILGIGGAVEYTGNSQLLFNKLTLLKMDLSILDIGIYLVIVLITFLTTRGVVSGLLKDILAEVQEAARALKKARRDDSPGGESITNAERDELLKEADDILTLIWRRVVRSKIAALFGIKFKDNLN